MRIPSIATALVCATLASGSAAAQCKQSLRPTSNPELTYRDRGGRCEGLFTQPIAASAQLEIVGYHGAPPRLPAQRSQEAQLKAFVTGASAVNIRALSTRHRQFYRMDAQVSAQSVLRWPMDVIRHQQVELGEDELAVIACIGDCEAREPRLVPVAIAPAAPARGPVAALLLRAAVELRELHVDLRHANGAQVFKGELLGGSSKPAGVPITFSLKQAASAGEYKFRATALPAFAAAADTVSAVLIVP